MNQSKNPSTDRKFFEFVAACSDRQTLMTALLGYAREFMTHRVLIRLKKRVFFPFEAQGWPEDLEVGAKRAQLRKQRVRLGALGERVQHALHAGEPVVGQAEEFGMAKTLGFLGASPTEQWMCHPIQVDRATEWILLGRPIDIDPSSPRFSEDAARLDFSRLRDACTRVGARYERLRRSGGSSPSIRPAAPADAPAKKPPKIDSAGGLTTGSFQGLLDARSMLELNYEQNANDGDDEAPMLADIEHTAGLELDTSVLRESKALYREAIQRESSSFDAAHQRTKTRRPAPSSRPVDAPLTAREKEKLQQAVALLSAPRLDEATRPRAFKAGAFLAQFGPRAVPVLRDIFPGCLVVDRYQYTSQDMPPIEQHGPVLHALQAIGQPAVEVARCYLDDASNDLRFYATFLFDGISAAQDLAALYERLFDRDRQTGEVARRILLAERGGFNFEHLVLRPLRREFRHPSEDARRLIALEALGHFQDTTVIEDLIEILKFGTDRPKQLAHHALQRITTQDFAGSAVIWEQWWRNRPVVQ